MTDPFTDWDDLSWAHPTNNDLPPTEPEPGDYGDWWSDLPPGWVCWGGVVFELQALLEAEVDNALERMGLQ